ncbi:type II toxin-antitoxin system HicB family antitoxin [Bacillus sp. NPDC077027]|uniref:type II toxin-antitoxin system HicB family antitoxin n=1 Tax=Bacillus sp. NPDC077027 TaxID=3390548 RepID=UPI003D08F007
MTMYRYYALIEKESGNHSDIYSVSFPDLENVFTDAESMQNAVHYAHEVLGSMLSAMEEDGDEIPLPSSADKLKEQLTEGGSLVLVEVETDQYNQAS